MKATISFDIEWWNIESPKTPIRAEHRSALLETAYDQIAGQIVNAADGYVFASTGLLQDNIIMDDEDPESGIAYKGKWITNEFQIQDSTDPT